MLNIFRIFISDFKRIKTNVVAVVIVIGLSILPCLYAWFNILSNWSPYGPDATSNIKVAVASDDKGITIDDTEFNMGETVIEGLEANTTIGWVFTDTTEEAIDGVYSGDYYAALIMPEDFTEDMVSFLADEMEHPEITYYTNEKKNAIAPKITDKAKTAVQQTVNTQFISTLIKSCMQVSDGLLDSSVLEEETGSSNVIDMLIGKLEEADADLAVYENLLDSLMSVSGNAASTTNQFSAVYPDMKSAITSGQSAMGNLQNVTGTGLASLGIICYFWRYQQCAWLYRKGIGYFEWKSVTAFCNISICEYQSLGYKRCDHRYAWGDRRTFRASEPDEGGRGI